MSTKNLSINVIFNTTSAAILADALATIAKDGHFDEGDLVFGLLGASNTMGQWGLSQHPPLLLPAEFGKLVAASPDASDNKGNPLGHQCSTTVFVEVESSAILPGASSGVAASGSFGGSSLAGNTLSTAGSLNSSNTTADGQRLAATAVVECRLIVWNTRYQAIVGLDNARTDPTLINIIDQSGISAVQFSFSNDVPGGAGNTNWQSELLLAKKNGLASHIDLLPSYPSHLISTVAFRGVNPTSNGPYLHLVLYPHRNDLPFDADQWLLTLPAESREVFKEKRHTCRLRLTKASLVESNLTNWSAFDGSVDRARAGLAGCVTPLVNLTEGEVDLATAIGRVGCPIPEPLKVCEPLREAGAKGIHDRATMVCWTISFDLSLLTNHIPVIEFEGFNNDATEPHVGSFCLLPDMFMLRDQTNGASGVAAVSDDKKFIGPVYMNYSIVRPFHHEKNNYRCVRSLESFARLSFKNVVGHRGLGKTYTDSITTQKFRAQKLSENSIPSFIAAHNRGASAIEFDVMLTRDRIPVVCHEPVFTVETITAGGRHMEQTEVFVHQVTKRQLDSLVKEALPAESDRQMRLKTLLEQHWRSILEMARGPSCFQNGALAFRRRVASKSGMIADGASNPLTAADVTPSSSSTVQQMMTASQTAMCGSVESGTTSVTQSNKSNIGPMGVTPITASRACRNAALIKHSPFIANTFSHIDKQIDLRIPTLEEVMAQTPMSLDYNMEIKFPFQPKADRNLHLQSDNFEINRYCDLILEVIFKFVDTHGAREIGFSSFDPDICTAMMLKQSRYHVLFLADCAERVDQKDYRSWGLEAPIQYALGERLAGVSIPSRSLLRPSDVETVLRNKVVMSRYQKDSREKQGSKRDDASLDTVDADYAAGIVRACNVRGLHVWTWGGANDNMVWCDMQRSTIGISGVITDNIPPIVSGEM